VRARLRWLIYVRLIDLSITAAILTAAGWEVSQAAWGRLPWVAYSALVLAALSWHRPRVRSYRRAVAALTRVLVSLDVARNWLDREDDLIFFIKRELMMIRVTRVDMRENDEDRGEFLTTRTFYVSPGPRVVLTVTEISLVGEDGKLLPRSPRRRGDALRLFRMLKTGAGDVSDFEVRELTGQLRRAEPAPDRGNP
jgi:hypothetical protein